MHIMGTDTAAMMKSQRYEAPRSKFTDNFPLPYVLLSDLFAAFRTSDVLTSLLSSLTGGTTLISAQVLTKNKAPVVHSCI